MTSQARDGVAGKLDRAAAVQPCKGHAVPLGNIADQAVPRTEVDLGIGRVDGELFSLGIEAEELAVFAAELAVGIGIADLPVPLRCMAAGPHHVKGS